MAMAAAALVQISVQFLGEYPVEWAPGAHQVTVDTALAHCPVTETEARAGPCAHAHFCCMCLQEARAAAAHEPWRARGRAAMLQLLPQLLEVRDAASADLLFCCGPCPPPRLADHSRMP